MYLPAFLMRQRNDDTAGENKKQERSKRILLGGCKPAMLSDRFDGW